MLAFAAAVFFLIGTPGPGGPTTAGVGSSFGWRAGLPPRAQRAINIGMAASLVAVVLLAAFA